MNFMAPYIPFSKFKGLGHNTSWPFISSFLLLTHFYRKFPEPPIQKWNCRKSNQNSWRLRKFRHYESNCEGTHWKKLILKIIKSNNVTEKWRSGGNSLGRRSIRTARIFSYVIRKIFVTGPVFEPMACLVKAWSFIGSDKSSYLN